MAVGTLVVAALVPAAFPLAAAGRFHAGAIACAALVYLTAFHRLVGDLTSIRDVTSGEMPPADDQRPERHGVGRSVRRAGRGFRNSWFRRGHRRHGVIYMGGSALVAIAGLVLVTAQRLFMAGRNAVRRPPLYCVYGRRLAWAWWPDGGESN